MAQGGCRAGTGPLQGGDWSLRGHLCVIRQGLFKLLIHVALLRAFNIIIIPTLHRRNGASGILKLADSHTVKNDQNRVLDSVFLILNPWHCFHGSFQQVPTPCALDIHQTDTLASKSTTDLLTSKELYWVYLQCHTSILFLLLITIISSEPSMYSLDRKSVV